MLHNTYTRMNATNTGSVYDHTLYLTIDFLIRDVIVAQMMHYVQRIEQWMSLCPGT